ncbi:MAG: acyl-CoA dehydrogenase family protein, partial [Hyphomicrobiales bacterium]
MDFSYTPEQLAFQEEVCSFLRQEWGPEDPTAGRDKRDRAREREFRKKVAKKGWLTIGWPKEWGGTDLTLMERYILSQEMNRHGAPISLYNVIVLGPLLIKYASDEAKNEFLPKMQEGQIDFVLGFTEPETGSDLANLQTRAVRQGDGYIINGQKLYGHPQPDDVMFLAVRTDPEAPIRKGISIFLVDANSEGLTITHNKTLAGQEVGATYYDNVFAPRSRLLGEENKGWDYIRETMDLDRAGGIPYAH